MALFAKGGDFDFREALAKSLAGTLGIVTALAVDFLQKGTESALVQTTAWLNQNAAQQLDMTVTPLVYVAALLIGGFVLVYIFEPDSKRNAFYAGAGVLGFLATFSPISEQALEVVPTDLPRVESGADATPGAAGGEDAVTPGTGDPAAPTGTGDDGAFLYQGAPDVIPAGFNFLGFRFGEESRNTQLAQAEALPVTVRIKFPKEQGPDMPRIYARLHDFIADRTYALGTGAMLKETSEGPIVIYEAILTTGAPKGDTIADLAIRIEAPGYAIKSAEATVTRASAVPVVLEVPMEPSNVPLAIQRLQHPYKF